ncbi:MAG: hypothetical protein ABIJ46_02065 [bacterium]
MSKSSRTSVRWAASAAATLAVALMPFGTSATTSIGTDISTGGNLTVNGNSIIGDAATDTVTITAVLQGASPLVFEGLTANDYEMTFAIADVTADRTITFPNGDGAIMLSSLTTNAPDVANSVTGASNGLLFEGATADEFETKIQPVDPTADNTVYLSDVTGYVLTSPGDRDASGGYKLAGQDFYYEGTTADTFEAIIRFPSDPTADSLLVLPTASGYPILSILDLQAADAFWGGSSSLIFEGATADDYETTLTLTDPTADRIITLPDVTGTVMLSTLAANGPELANSVTGASDSLIFEGTADGIETILTMVDATGTDKTITLPNLTGTVLLATMENLGSTAINTSLISDTVNTDDLGSEALNWANLYLGTGLQLEGATDDDYQLLIRTADITVSDKTATFPNATGTVVLTEGTGTYSSTNVVSLTTIDGDGSIEAGTCDETDNTITVTGAETGDAVIIGPPSALDAGLIASGRVSAADTVTIRLCNVSAAPVAPTDLTWRATVLNY